MKKTGILIALIILAFGLACEQQEKTYTTGKQKAQSTEPKLNLPTIAGMQIGFKAENSRYAKTFAELQYSMIGNGSVYSYFLGDDVIKGAYGPDALPDDIEAVEPTAEEFVVYAVANLDSDEDLDVWMIDQNRSIQHVQSDVP